MTERERKRLATAGAELASWRREHGGRGKRIPEALWAGAVELARAVGPATTADALQLDPVRLETRVRRAGDPRRAEVGAGATFVEVGALPLVSSPTVVEFVSREGDRMRIETGGPLDVFGLSRAFWSRRP
jgi:hypothetical protein